MKPALPIVAAIVALLPSIAHADEKADAILKEVRLRMNNATTYSVTIQYVDDQKKEGKVRIAFQRPDKFFIGMSEKGKEETAVTVIKGKSIARQHGVKVPISDKEGNAYQQIFMPIISADFPKLFVKGVTSTKYVTQKNLDETTVVDVVDVAGPDPGHNVRVYVDNNSQIRKIVTTFQGRINTLNFTNPIIDQPISESIFPPK